MTLGDLTLECPSFARRKRVQDFAARLFELVVGEIAALDPLRADPFEFGGEQ